MRSQVFSPIYIAGTWSRSWRWNSQKCGDSSITESFQSFILRLVHTEPLRFINCNAGFPTLALVPVKVSLMGFCSRNLWLSEFTCLYSFGGELLWTHFSEEAKKSCGFFHLFSFWLTVRMEWGLLSFLHAKWETRSLEVSISQDDSDACMGFELISFQTLKKQCHLVPKKI